MKKYIFLVVFSLILQPAGFSMDTEIPGVNLTKNRMRNLVNLVNPNPFKGFSLHADGTAVGVSDTAPTLQQVEAARDAINALSDTLTKEAYADAFSVELFFKTMKNTFSKPNLVSFAPQISMILKYADAKDFAGLKLYMNELLSQGIINQEKWNAINTLFKLQNIDLLDW